VLGIVALLKSCQQTWLDMIADNRAV